MDVWDIVYADNNRQVQLECYAAEAAVAACQLAKARIPELLKVIKVELRNANEQFNF